MKTVILAGGKGTRFIEETIIKPKPMIEIGGKPMLWHIMKIYESHGFRDFIVACGYKGDAIRSYFSSFLQSGGDIHFDLARGKVETIRVPVPEWRIWLMETGLDTMTGGRLLRLKELIGNERFMLTYGDGVANIDIKNLLEFHETHKKIATVTAIKPPAQFGRLVISDHAVKRFSEKEESSDEWINGGFFVFEPQIFDFLDSDSTVLEKTPMERLCIENQIVAYRHEGFWSHMDTVHEQNTLQRLWLSGDAPWKIWK